jgi:hypothetical protein
MERRYTMREKRQICNGELTMNRARPSVGAATGTSRLVVVVVGVLCLVLVSVAVHAAAAGTPTSTPRLRRPAGARQIQKAASLYSVESPVRLEVHVVKLELGAAENVAQAGKSIAQLLSVDRIEAQGLDNFVDSLQSFGETALLHSGVCLLTSDEPTHINSGRTVPVRRSGPAGEGGDVQSVEYRELGRKLIANLYGVDAQGRICFSYDISVSYVENEAGGAETAPTFASFSTQARGKLRDGQTLVIQNLDHSTVLLVFMTPHIAE